MKRILITLALILSLLPCVAFTTPSTEMGDYYPRMFIVESLDYERDVVVLLDGVGMLWEMEDCDDWEIGDTVAAIMYNNGNNILTDDSIVDVRWGGVNIPIEIWLQ